MILQYLKKLEHFFPRFKPQLKLAKCADNLVGEKPSNEN